MIRSSTQFQTSQTSAATLGAPYSLPISTREHNYGILNLETHEENQWTQDQQSPATHFVMTCDRSGSMDYSGLDCGWKTGTSKMDFLKQTLNNMVRWLSEQQDKTFYLTIIAFDDRVELPIEHLEITSDNVEEIIKTIGKIYARNTTNIELALEKAKEILEKYDNPEVSQSHIFMTDGEITAGSSNIDHLKSLINYDLFQSFIGYGTDHNIELLRDFSSELKSNYYFVESMENTGMVYGEIVHNVLNNIINNVTIKMQEDIEIYNYYKNEWQTTLEIGSLPTDVSKTYHIRYPWSKHGRSTRSIYKNPLSLEFEISYKHINANISSTLFCTANVTNRENDDFNDFRGRLAEKYMWRLRTLELLYESSILKKDRSPNLRSELKSFLKSMRGYIERYDLSEDPFMKNLCDDIYISIKAHNSYVGNMFICARQSSQGQQRAYNMVDIDELIPSPSMMMAPPLRARGGGHHVRFALPTSDDEYEEDDYELSTDTTTPYISAPQGLLMRTLSSQPIA